MSTNPTPQPQNEIATLLHAELANLAHRTVTLSYGVLGVLVLVLALAGGGAYLGLRQYDKLAVKADAQDQLFVASMKDFQTQIAQHDAERQAAEAKVSELQARIAQRSSQPLPAPVQAALNENSDTKTVIGGLIAVYGPQMDPTPTPDGKVALSPANARETIQAKVDGTTALANFQDSQAILNLQTGIISMTNKDLTTCRADLGIANKTIADYKAVVKPSRFKRFLSGAKTAIMVAAAAYVGHKL